jgi:hypothetical protein
MADDQPKALLHAAVMCGVFFGGYLPALRSPKLRPKEATTGSSRHRVTVRSAFQPSTQVFAVAHSGGPQ